MVALYQIQDLSFAYAGEGQNVLQEISLTLQRGEFALFCGPTGSGKTTLLRLLKKEVQPAGAISGSILYEGSPLEKLGRRRGAEEIAMVFQDPDEQIVMETVWQELTFAMENMGYETGSIQRRLAEVASYFGMESWLHKHVHELSGGRKQLLNLAAVVMLRPKVLLLDEPTAQLDPVAAKNFLQTVCRINQEFSTAVILCEHRLEELFPLATRVLMLDGGRVKYQGSPAEVIREVWRQKDERFLEYLPSVSRLFLSLNGRLGKGPGKNIKELPLTVREARSWLEESDLKLNMNPPGKRDNREGEKPAQALLSCREIYFQYDRNQPMVLKNFSCGVQKGECYALLGGNGSGKTTLLKTIAGILKPQRGKIIFAGKNLFKMRPEERRARIGYLAQSPSLYFNRDTVEAQLKDRARKLGLGASSQKLEETINFFNLESVMKKHPYDLSGGQQQKVALALVLMSEPELILLDEPTKGLDPLWKLQLAGMLSALQKRGKTILMVSHDIEFVARFAQKCALLFDGRAIAPDTPHNFFSQNYFYTTAIHRAVGDKFPRIVNIEDVSI